MYFDAYSFGARCYNTLRCSIQFCRTEFALTNELVGPSGEPHRPDWKDQWTGGFSHGDEPRDAFPTPVDIWWTAMDGVARETSVNLDEIFPDRKILHKLPLDEIDTEWLPAGMGQTQIADILVEVNDKTINVYMRVMVRAKSATDASGDPKIFDDLVLAWSKTY